MDAYHVRNESGNLASLMSKNNWLERRLGRQLKPCIIHGGNLQRTMVDIQ
jgi:hypothetical protein